MNFPASSVISAQGIGPRAALLPQSTFSAIALLILGLTSAVNAGPRSSTSYIAPADSSDAGGRRGTSTNYTNDGSVGTIGGIATVASPALTAKTGYIGQLYEVAMLQLAATPATVNEAGTRQVSAMQLLDDGSMNAVPVGSITWSVQAGPLSGISNGGLATAATVYQDASATIQGVFEGLAATLGLTVINHLTDNHGSYAGDGLDDGWQVQHFGLDNPSADPSFDADSDGQDNAFELIAGLSPTDASSRFLISPSPVANQPGQMNIVIHPRLPDRIYTVKSSPTLGTAATWVPLTSFSIADDGTTRTITDLDAGGSKRFYRVEIAKP
jgi:hypothetical protein